MDRPHDDLPRRASSTKCSGATASAIRSSIGSSPNGVIWILPPSAKPPISSIRSMSPFHSGHRATSTHKVQICSGVALVSALCSFTHM